MNKRSFSILILGCILLVAGGAAYLVPAPSEDVPSKVVLRNSGGRVVFDHALHTSIKDVDCESCHHDMKVSGGAGPEDILACGTCHLGEKDANFVKSHQARYDTTDGGLACKKCHHMLEIDESSKDVGSAVAASMIADAESNGDDNPFKCSPCHETVSRMDAFHKNCLGCHDTMSKGPGSKAQCAQCHTSK